MSLLSKQKRERKFSGVNTLSISKSLLHKVQLIALHQPRFASAVTGMPMLLRDVDITSDWPADVDDEYINPQGLCPALPGEVTKMSSALSLFKISRILAKALEHLYPAGANYSLSITKLHSLSDELDQWHEELPDHLRLRFCNDKPATNMTSDRSPLLVSGSNVQF